MSKGGKRRGYIVSCLLSLAACRLYADDCLKYKTLPSVEIKVPAYSASVTRPERGMDLMHGNVVSTLAEEYDVEYGAAPLPTGGWCVFIERIVATIGYTDFVIQIDKRHMPGGCEFNAIKQHEDEHVRAHLSVIEDEKKEIKQGIFDAAENVLPVFAAAERDFDSAMTRLESDFESRPQIKLLRRKLAAGQEIKDKKIDLDDKGRRVRACGGPRRESE